MSEPTVLASYCEIAAPDGKIMGAGHVAVPAFGFLNESPEIEASDFGERALFAYILNTGNKYPCRTAVIAYYLRLVWYSSDNLIGILFAMITVGAITGKNKPVAHGKYWGRAGSLNCCQESFYPVILEIPCIPRIVNQGIRDALLFELTDVCNFYVFSKPNRKLNSLGKIAGGMGSKFNYTAKSIYLP
jgi:hypothetical protein